MIIDFRSDANHAFRYNVLCARTGESLNHLPIWYADDEAGILRLYVHNDKGDAIPDETGEGLLSEERRKVIKIVPKPADELRSMDETHERLTAELAAEREAARAAERAKAASFRRCLDNALAAEMREAVDRAQVAYHRDVLAPRRLKLLKVSGPMFIEFLRAGIHAYEVIDHALPDDARIVDMTHDFDHFNHQYGTVTLKVESEAYPPVPEGERIPELKSPIIRRLAPDPAYESPDY
jgi:hypothetical protein